MKRFVIACLIIALLGGAGYGVHAWYVHTHCSLILGREECGIDRYMPMLPM